MSHLHTAQTWIYQQLASDTALTDMVTGIEEHPAPRDTTWPVVTIQLLTAIDTNGIGIHRALTRGDWLVRVIGRDTGYADLVDAAARIDQLLTSDTCAQIPGAGTFLASTRVQEFSQEDVIDGVTFRHLGGIYQVVTST